MPLPEPLNPGTIFWTGDNPGIMLKERDDGPWSALALFFRIAWSPVGQGHALLLLEKPDLPKSLPEAANVVMSDNEPLARLLMSEFVGKLRAFSDPPGFKAAKTLSIAEVYATGDPGSRYTEVVKGNGLTVELVWDGLGRPTALELPPPLTGTKQHTMFSILVESRDPAIVVNGRRLPGRPVPRVQAGIQTTSAFLYFAETWISPPAG